MDAQMSGTTVCIIMGCMEGTVGGTGAVVDHLDHNGPS